MRRTNLDSWIAQKIDWADQALTRTHIEDYQLAQLRKMLALVQEKSSFYRQHLTRSVSELTCLDDWSHIPFTTADDIRANPLQFVCGSQDAIQRVVTLESSGTTGKPKRIYFTHEDQELTVDFFRVGMSTFTGPGDRVLILLPGATPGSVGDLLSTALTRLGAIPFKHGPVRDPTATLDLIQREHINVIVGVPTHVLALARRSVQPPLRLKSVLLTTDHVPNTIKRAVESTWNCTVYNHYGMTEMGLGGGVECEARCGYHVREADMLFEIIDPETGKALPDDVYGEVVFTTLTRHGMPLIRYRTGDVSRFISNNCACGTALRLLERISYRLNGRIPLDGGILTIADLNEALFSVENILDFRATLGNEQGRRTLLLEINWLGAENPKAAFDAIMSTIPMLQKVDIRFRSGDAMPMSMAKRVIDESQIKFR